MSNTGIFRVLLGTAGVILSFVSLINVWVTWMSNMDTSFHWTLAIVGGVLWLQAVPVLQAGDRAERKQQILDELNRRK